MLLVAVLGVLWHASLLMLNDGLRRGQYDELVRALNALPPDEQSDAREHLVGWTRYRITPFGVAFSRWWRVHRPGRGKAGRAWNANQQVNRLGVMEWRSGAVLVLLLFAWMVVGTTTVRCHIGCLVGGTIGGIALGALCLWAGLVLTALAHVVGAGGGALSLVGIADWAKKL